MICALVDERIDDASERALTLRGFRVIRLPASKSLTAPIASHPDMLAFYYKNKIITSAEYCERAPYVFSDLRELLPSVSVSFTDESPEEKYPRDAIFNALPIGKYLFCKADTVSKSVLEYARDCGLEIVATRQGYPACTTLAFGNSAITADPGMANALTAAGITVTVIKNGNIELPPYDYGFIGGAAGVFKNTVYFLGNIDTHPDAESILAAIAAEGFSAVSLSDGPLRDLGRIIFID